MYRPTPTLRDRAGPLAAVVLVHAVIGYGLLHMSGADVELAKRADLAIFDILVPPPQSPPPPPPPPPPPVSEARQQSQPARPRQEEGGAAAPKNIDNQATPVVAPRPVIVIPVAPPVITAPVPATGTAPTQGASPVISPGSGAGGTGNGTGSGGSGSGSGGGGAGGAGGLGEARATLLSPSLTRRDYPASLLRRAPPGGSVFIIVRVGADGTPVSCRTARSFGDPVIDAETCRLAVERFRFAPGRDDQGRAVADFFGYRQDFDTRF